MGKNYSRIQRGQVYWFDIKNVYGHNETYIGYNSKQYKSHIQMGNRPYLVVSNNEGNNSSPTCNIVPITLEDKTRIPTHVYFNFEGRGQTVLCEQIVTVDSMALDSYIYTVSDEVMSQVERALTIQFGVRPEIAATDVNLGNVVDTLEKIVQKIIESKRKELEKPQPIQKEQLEEVALNLGVILEEVTGVSHDSTPAVNKEIKQPTKGSTKQEEKVAKSVTEPAKKKNYSGMSPVEKFNARYKLDKQPEKAETPEPKKKRNSWNAENCKRFLKDCEELPLEDVAKKYGLNTMQSVLQTKYKCRNILGIVTK